MDDARRTRTAIAIAAAVVLVGLAMLAVAWIDDPEARSPAPAGAPAAGAPTPQPPPLAPKPGSGPSADAPTPAPVPGRVPHLPPIPPPAEAARAPIPPPRTIAHTTPGPARGAVLVLHGGGFRPSTDAALQVVAGVGRQMASWGYDVELGTYHAGIAGGADVAGAVQRLAERYGGRLCVYGQSAGGYWAVRAAQVLPDRVRCAIGAAALLELDISPSARADALAAAVARNSFGDVANRRAHSPTTYAATNPTPTLLLTTASDLIVRSWQAYEYAAAHDHTQVVDLPTGDLHWIHGMISPAAVAQRDNAVRGFLADHL